MTPRWPSLRLALAGLALGAAVWGCAAGTLPPVASEGQRLEQARRAMSKREYSFAIELLKSYIDHNAGSRDVDEAIYRLGMCYLGTREWPSAEVEFERLLRDYPESDSSGSAAFRLGEALIGQSRPRDFDQEFTAKALEQWRIRVQCVKRLVTLAADCVGETLDLERRNVEVHQRLAHHLEPGFELRLHQLVHAKGAQRLELGKPRRPGHDVKLGIELARPRDDQLHVNGGGN